LLEGRLNFTAHSEQRLYTFSGQANLGGLVAGAVPSLAMVTPGGDRFCPVEISRGLGEN